MCFAFKSLGTFKIDPDRHAIFKIDDFLGSVKPPFRGFANIAQDRYILTDGVGVISRKFAEEIMQFIGLDTDKYFPSAFQIRMGGCKGMLTVNEHVDGRKDKESDYTMLIRDSMMKFESNDNTMRILKWAAPRAVFLNKPLVNILDQVQVDTNVFYDFFESNSYVVALASMFDSHSIDLIHTHSVPNFPFQKILDNHISLSREPFFRDVIDYLSKYRMWELRVKSRIAVPFSNGRTAFGVADESGQLKPGEVSFGLFLKL